MRRVRRNVKKASMRLFSLPGSMTIVLLVIMIAAACTKEKPAAPRTVPVVAEMAVRRDIPLQIRAIGNVEAYNAVMIKSMVNGEVAGVYFKEGQELKKDALLFKIDPRPFEAALRQAEAALARDLAQAKNAEEQAKRYAILIQKDYVSRDQYDQIRANADALAAAVEADRANVENYKLQLAYSIIKSPINGRAGSVLVNAGNIIKANDSALTSINQIMPIYVTFSVPEQYLPEIKKHAAAGDLKVEAIIPGKEARPARGELTFIDNTVDRTTGTIKLKGTFANRDESLWPGLFVDVILTLTMEKDQTLVPSQAVQTGQQGQYVYIIKDDLTVELRAVTVERTFENKAVIPKGVVAGEKVVTDGQLRLVPGAKVEIKNEQKKPILTTETPNTQRKAETNTEPQATKGK